MTCGTQRERSFQKGSSLGLLLGAVSRGTVFVWKCSWSSNTIFSSLCLEWSLCYLHSVSHGERRSCTCSSQWGQSWGRRDVLEERWRCCLHRRQHKWSQHRPVQFQLWSQPVILLSWCNYKLTFIWLMVLPGNFKGWSTTTERLKSITVLGQLQERFLWLKKTALFCAALNSTLPCLPIQLPQEGAPSSG